MNAQASAVVLKNNKIANFDLNKFSFPFEDDGDEDKGKKEFFRSMLRIYFDKFY